MIKQLTALSSIFVFTGIIVSGSVKLLDYSTRPGESGEVPASIHEVDVLKDCLTPTKSTVLLFLHPHCPCTKATIKNLCAVLKECPSSVECCAIAFCPKGKADDWIQSPIVNMLTDKVGVNVIVDRGSSVIESFGIKCSGHVLVYDEDGGLQFSGGITRSRGHEGSCLPLSDLRKFLLGDAGEPVNWPVFGCSLTQAKEHAK